MLICRGMSPSDTVSSADIDNSCGSPRPAAAQDMVRRQTRGTTATVTAMAGRSAAGAAQKMPVTPSRVGMSREKAISSASRRTLAWMYPKRSRQVR